VDEALAMERVEPRTGLGGHPEELVQGERSPFPDALLQRASRHVFHRQVAPPLRLSGVQDGNQVLVVHFRGHSGFVNESPPVDLVPGQLSFQDLQGDDGPVGVADRKEDNAHGALAENGLQEIRTQPFARQQLALPRHGPQLSLTGSHVLRSR
jgi:hypothetical protein